MGMRLPKREEQNYERFQKGILHSRVFGRLAECLNGMILGRRTSLFLRRIENMDEEDEERIDL